MRQLETTKKVLISFSKLSYTEKDAGKTFTYTVNEKLPSEADTYVYDKTVYTVTVNVEDNRDGTLKLTTKVNGEDYTETAMKFCQRYYQGYHFQGRRHHPESSCRSKTSGSR